MLHFLMVNVIFQTFTLPYFNVFHYTATNPMLLTKQKILKKKVDHQILLDVDLTVQEFWIFLEFCDVWFLISFPRNQLLITIGPTSFLVDCNSQFGVVH